MSPDTIVKIVAAILLVVVLAILVLRRKGKKMEPEDDDFWSEILRWTHGLRNMSRRALRATRDRGRPWAHPTR